MKVKSFTLKENCNTWGVYIKFTESTGWWKIYTPCIWHTGILVHPSVPHVIIVFPIKLKPSSHLISAVCPRIVPDVVLTWPFKTSGSPQSKRFYIRQIFHFHIVNNNFLLSNLTFYIFLLYAVRNSFYYNIFFISFLPTEQQFPLMLLNNLVYKIEIT